jgi:hypothetical protein
MRRSCKTTDLPYPAKPLQFKSSAFNVLKKNS